MIYSMAFLSEGKTLPNAVTFSPDYRAWAWSSVGFDTVMSSIVRLATEKINSDRKKRTHIKNILRQNNEKAGRGRQKGPSIYQWGGNNAPTGRVSMRDFSMHTLQWKTAILREKWPFRSVSVAKNRPLFFAHCFAAFRRQWAPLANATRSKCR